MGWEQGAPQMYSSPSTTVPLPSWPTPRHPQGPGSSLKNLGGGAPEQGSHCMRPSPSTAIKHSFPYKNNSTREACARRGELPPNADCGMGWKCFTKRKRTERGRETGTLLTLVPLLGLPDMWADPDGLSRPTLLRKNLKASRREIQEGQQLTLCWGS